MFVTSECLDPDLADPFIDIDEQRTVVDPASGATLNYRYIHGGFTGTDARFSFYFPPPDQYRGRFFHGTYPTVSQEDAGDDSIVFALTNGAYVVSSNNAGGVSASPALGGYRVNGAAAKFSRQIAPVLYGEGTPVRGYLYGASGGAYQSIGGLESTSGVWDGAVPMVPGTPNSIPSFQGAMLLGLRVLGDALAGVVDSLEPGGSGDPYAGLSDDQAAILEEITLLGFPPRGWWQYELLDGGSFWAVAGGVKTVDPTYVDDFWNTPGYEGADPSSAVGADRIQFDTTVTAVSDSTVTLAEAPSGNPIGIDLEVTSGAAAGQSADFVTIDGSEVRVGGGLASTLKPGDRVRLDNSWVLALQYYHRYQVPPAESFGDLRGWDQFRDASGEPVHPQRSMLVGPVFAGVSGGVATGRFDGKMIVLASVKDIEAFPWSADWYQGQVRAATADEFDDTFRLWFMDNADHTPPKTTEANAHIVSYGGEMEQALLDLDAWVANDIAPPPSSSYEVGENNQIELAADVADRGGVQPVVGLSVGASDDCADTADGVTVDVSAGEPVVLAVTAELPPDTGEIVRVEWDFEGTGEFPAQAELETPSAPVDLCETHIYDSPGTYFAVVRVTAQRDGNTESPYGLVQNLARVRVVVH